MRDLDALRRVLRAQADVTGTWPLPELQDEVGVRPTRGWHWRVTALALTTAAAVVAAVLVVPTMLDGPDRPTATRSLVPSVEGLDFNVVSRCAPGDLTMRYCAVPQQIASDGAHLSLMSDEDEVASNAAGSLTASTTVEQPGAEVWVLVGTASRREPRLAVDFNGTITAENTGSRLYRVSGMPAGELRIRAREATGPLMDDSLFIAFYEVDDDASDEPVCPAELPFEPHDRPWPESAEETSTVPAYTRAWRCRYGADIERRDPEPGFWWRLQGEPEEVDDADRARLDRELRDLRPYPTGLVCTMDLGPRWAVVLEHTGGRTAVVVDDFGCRWVRLTGDLAAVSPGTANSEDAPPGAFRGSRELLDVVSDGQALER